ncbi:hypothetical protein BpHYR1_052531 [Brachionus plicatilis]|uniref:Uncharacterized protein n=1 Tax=Brachionus plicatilis TaxID=10195 RepID=A0A3M7PKG8_BRAPC|nr:hypothetical protein BpHYR1_052531 [Brachionus plicatilis]
MNKEYKARTCVKRNRIKIKRIHALISISNSSWFLIIKKEIKKILSIVQHTLLYLPKQFSDIMEKKIIVAKKVQQSILYYAAFVLNCLKEQKAKHHCTNEEQSTY